MATACTSKTKLHAVINHKTIPVFTIMKHVSYVLCTYCFLGSTRCFAIQSDACLTTVVGLLLIMRFNIRKWGRMTGRTVKMETWVGTDGQGLYRVELHYNRIDRRRRHTLSHNLGLQSRLKCISHS